MSSPMQPKKPLTDDQIVDHLRALTKAEVQKLPEIAPEITRNCFADLRDYPDFQTAEILRQSLEDLLDNVVQHAHSTNEANLARAYFKGEGSRLFHSTKLEKRIEQSLVASH